MFDPVLASIARQKFLKKVLFLSQHTAPFSLSLSSSHVSSPPHTHKLIQECEVNDSDSVWCRVSVTHTFSCNSKPVHLWAKLLMNTHLCNLNCAYRSSNQRHLIFNLNKQAAGFSIKTQCSSLQIILMVLNYRLNHNWKAVILPSTSFILPANKVYL